MSYFVIAVVALFFSTGVSHAADLLGNLDAADCTSLAGWVYDPDTPSTAVSYHVYKDGPAGGGGTFVTLGVTNVLRPDVNAAFGITGNHGFSIPTPASLKDGLPHTIWVHGIDTSNAGPNVFINRSGLSTTCSAPAPNAQFVSQSVSSAMTAGQSYAVSVTMKNTGTTHWSLIGPQMNAYRLASQNPMDNSTWGIIRAELSATVASGSQTTINFNVTAPATPGNYNFQWQMIKEGVQRFGDLTPNVSVLVKAPVVNKPPLGWLDAISPDGMAGGWALDPDHFSSQISVHMYIDGPAGGGGVFAAVADTTGLRPDVNATYGITGNHGFNIRIPDKFRDGKAHKVYIHAIDPDDPSGASNVVLPGCPKSFTLIIPPPPNVPFKIVNSAALQAYALAPSIVKVNGNSHAFYCSNANGPNGEWDYIRHVSSADGVNWSQPVIKVKTKATGTRGQIDNPSACDPSVIYWQGHYYLFYSGYRVGLSTVVQVARSATIDGVYATYTQSGKWTVDPATSDPPKTIVRGQSPIRFGSPHCASFGWPPNECPWDYGAGQQFLVIHNGKLRMWFTDTTLSPLPGPPQVPAAEIYMMESDNPLVWNTAGAVKSLLPAGSNTNEIKFHDAINRFVMFRLDPYNHTVDSALSVGQSSDGIHWEPFTVLMPSQNFPNFANNSGFLSDGAGHIIPGENILVGFAAPNNVNTETDTWGIWNLWGINIPQSQIPQPTPSSLSNVSDKTPPSVSITSPANNATISGSSSITVRATASDNVGVVGVRFKIDGKNLGSEDTSSPYSVSLKPSDYSNGIHTITATARDKAGNTQTASITVKRT